MKKAFVLLVLLTLALGAISPTLAQDVELRYFMWDPSFEETEQRWLTSAQQNWGSA
jgi:hypothetical protein